MKSNYKEIGNYINEINNRNTDLKIKNLLGINIDKYFMPSVANVIGTDLSTYKVVKYNQFACNRMHVGRDYRLPVSISKNKEDFIVSPAYNVFEVSDTSYLNPDYLMMWFMRSEFDRNAWFYTDADVRGGLSWDALCEMKIPIPSIDEQLQFVSQFELIKQRISISENIIKNLEDINHAIFKNWFLDFNFPNTDSKPYKDSGGKMVWSEELQKKIPESWKSEPIQHIVSSTLGGDWGKDAKIGNYNESVYCIRGTDIPIVSKGGKVNIPKRFILSKNLKTRKLYSEDIIIEISGGSPTQSTGRTVHINKNYLENINLPLICSNFCRIIKSKENYSEYLNSIIKYFYKSGILFKYENSSNNVKNLALDDVLKEEIIVIPPESILKKFNKIYNDLYNYLILIGMEIENMNDFLKIILSKIAVKKE